MSAELLAAKTVIEEKEPEIRQVEGVPTAIGGAIGVAERGPMVATLVYSFAEYKAKFGGFTANAQDLPLAVQSFFDEGGKALWVARVVHYTTISNSATIQSAAGTNNLLTATSAPSAGSVTSSLAGPWELDHGQTLVIQVDGDTADTVTISAVAATVTAGNTGTYVLTDGMTLTFEVQGSVRTVTFNTAEFVSIGAATAAEVAAVINAEAAGVTVDVDSNAPRITSDLKGTDSALGNFGGTALAVLGFTGLSDTGTGDFADVANATAAELKTLIEADVAGGSGVTVTEEALGYLTIESNTTGGSSSVQVQASSTADALIGFDNATHSGGTGAAVNTLKVDGKTHGAYANNVSVLIEAATNGESGEFNLTVLESGNIVESWSNLSMDDAAENYVETIVNAANGGSNLITVTDLDAAVATAADQRPANASTTLAGGDDGLTGLSDTDFLGSSVTATGLRMFDTVNNISLLFAPGRATSAVQNGLLTYAEVTRDKSMFALLDPPEGLTAAEMVTWVKSTAALQGASEFGAIYWPRVKILNPSNDVFGSDASITVAPSGLIAGMIARNDAANSKNKYEAPAGLEGGLGRLITATGIETDEVKDESKRDIVFPELINPIWTDDGIPVHVDGARTLKSTGPFPTIGERRGVIFIEQSLKRSSMFSRHRKIKKSLLARMKRMVVKFLLDQTADDAFASDDPTKAFLVDVSGGPLENGTLNNASTAAQRQTKIRVGLATAKPNEFTIITVSQDQRALQQEIAIAA